jgi:hypothetical protein
MTTRQTTLYCHELPRHDGTGTWYAHFFPNPNVTRLCGPEPVVKALVSSSDESPDCYWGWWDNADQAFHYVYPRKCLVEICFPYGTKAEAELGRGELMPVRIEVLP